MIDSTTTPYPPVQLPLPTVAHILGQFTPIGLDQLGGAALLDRVDTKYTVTMGQLAVLLPLLQPSYRVLSVNGARLNRYHTVYYDTPSFGIYTRHHNGSAERYKVRARRYEETGVSFFEVKHRTHGRRTVKSRLPLTEFAVLTAETDGFLGANTPYRAADLEAKLWNDYRRITLVSKTSDERVTVDLDVSFGWQDAMHTLDGVAIIEIKRAASSQHSDVVPHLRRMGLRPASLSKYCTGVVLLYPQVKSNNFKPQMRRLSKLIGQESRYVGY